MFKFDLEDRVRDKVNNYFGVVTARCDYIGGSSYNRYLVEGKDSTGRPIENWCYESRLEIDNGPRR